MKMAFVITRMEADWNPMDIKPVFPHGIPTDIEVDTDVGKVFCLSGGTREELDVGALYQLEELIENDPRTDDAFGSICDAVNTIRADTESEMIIASLACNFPGAVDYHFVTDDVVEIYDKDDKVIGVVDQDYILNIENGI